MVADNGETEQTLKQGFWALVRATGRSLIDLIRFDSIRFQTKAVNILPGVYTSMMQLNVGLTHTLA